VAFTLAMGTGRLARQGGIVKRLASAETLGSTSQICTDKTGTLTLNEMTARELVLAGREFTVSGEGYRTGGRIRTTDGTPIPSTVDRVLHAMALCTDAVLREGNLLGDPTEGALVVLAEKGGIDVARLRRERPQVLEIPFDSDYKFMATFHRWRDDRGRDVVHCFVKGAPDVLAGRADRYLASEEILPFDDAARRRYSEANASLAEHGMRVMAVGAEDFPGDGFEPAGDLKDMLDRIVLLALVGIVDPPRPEARKAIAECRQAGIRVRMLTGDHAVTARAIATQLGIPGDAVRGADLDDRLGRLDRVGVVARVSPAHKIRIVEALQERGDVVAMTGDGINDAPALRKADIGVAMGVTGTEVTKEAAVMAAGTIAVLVLAPGPEPQLGVATVAGTMAFVTFVFFQAFNLLNVRHDTRSVFSRETLGNPSAFLATGVVIVLLVLVVEMDIIHNFFTTTDLTSGQWLTCAAVGSGILWAGEFVKMVLRAHSRGEPPRLVRVPETFGPTLRSYSPRPLT
jgi:P-type Ca2+ transporter type 2C